MTAPDNAYRPVRASKYRAMTDAFRDVPQVGGRFVGTAKRQADLAEQMRELFDADPGPDVVMLKHSDTLGLADKLAKSQEWDPGNYAEALATLLQP